MKKIVVSALGNRIYHANVNNKGCITGEKKDITNECIHAVFEWLKNSLPKDKKIYEIRYENEKGFVLKFEREE